MTYAVPGPIRTNIVSSTSVGGIDSPFTRTRAVLDMMKGWEIMKAVTEGTEYLRENSEAFLPLEPREDYDAYLARVNRSVFSPFTQRLIRAARRKSFCARMKGMPGPLKDKKGRPTRKALALKRWRC